MSNDGSSSTQDGDRGKVSAVGAPSRRAGVYPSSFSSWFVSDRADHDLLFDRRRPDWFNLEGDAGAQLVKRNAARRVYRVDFNGDAAYVKHHLRSGLVSWVKDRLFGSPAAREFEAARYAAGHGVAAVAFWARAEGGGGDAPRVSLSIAPAVDNIGSLAEQFDQTRSIVHPLRRRRRRGDLLTAAARLLAQSHNAAFLHPDNHPGNILVQECDDGTIRCLYVDVYGARCGPQVSDADAARNLAALHQWFTQRATRTERLRALRAYLLLRQGAVGRAALKRFALCVLAESRRHANTLHRKRDRRIGRNNAYFAGVTLGDGWRASLTLRFRNLARQIPVTPPAADRDERVIGLRGRFTSSGAADPRCTLCDEADTERFFPRRAWDRWVWRFFGSQARRRYRTASLAMNRDVPCVAGTAHLERLAAGGVAESAWLQLRPVGSQVLTDWLPANYPTDERRAVCDAVGRLLADTCSRGLAIHNAEPARIAVSCNGDGPSTVYWQGIEGIALAAPLGVHAQNWLLTLLASRLSNVDERRVLAIARILRRFCLHTGRVARNDNWKCLWRKIAAQATLR